MTPSYYEQEQDLPLWWGRDVSTLYLGTPETTVDPRSDLRIPRDDCRSPK